MTATRDRTSDLDDEPAAPAWDERPIFGKGRGLPWWAAVLLAFGVAGIAAFVDMQRQGSLGRIYQGAYILGCVIAVAWVRRRNLFGPMVQPPLVFAVTAVGAVVLAQPGSPFSSGVKQLLFSVALPLTSNFPTMGLTTAVTVAIGLARLWLQRDPNPRIRPSRSARAMLDDDRDPPPSRSRRTQPHTNRTRPEVDDERPRSRPARDDGWESTPRPEQQPPAANRPRTNRPPADPRRRPSGPRRPDQDPDRRR